MLSKLVVDMPTYEYRCDTCDLRFDIVQSFADDALTKCPKASDEASPASCASPGKGKVKKVFSAPAITFKGDGFYKNDSRVGAGKSSSAATAGDSSDSKSNGSSKDSSSDSSSGGSDKGSSSKSSSKDSNGGGKGDSGNKSSSQSGSKSATSQPVPAGA